MNLDKHFLDPDEFDNRTRMALSWLMRSFDICAGGGSSAYFTELWKPFGWAPSYPETTGYIIDTLYNYQKHHPELPLANYAQKNAEWLCDLQLPEGAMPGGFGDTEGPSVFNTGQILIGLIRTYEETKLTHYLDIIDKAVSWLVENQDSEGNWHIGAYIPDYNPSYYSRVIWPILWANQYLNEPTIEAKMIHALHCYKERVTKKKSVKDWSFRTGQKAFTHTIAYTIRGFYESAILLDDEEIMQVSLKLAEKVMRLREIRGKLAGWYDENWNGDFWFTCLTGNCQLSIIFSKIFLQTGDIRFFNTALKLFEDVLPHQNMDNNLNKRGAIPGSAPFWGRYLTLRYPNWATKFFLDAYEYLMNSMERVEQTL